LNAFPVFRPRARVFGRDADVERVRERLIHGDRRVLTLVGAGGVGKTTLAYEVARAAESAFPDGVRVVDLTRVTSPDDVAITWVHALGISDRGRDPRDLLGEVLAPRQLLVVVDNCEHVIAGVAALVDALMDVCPDLRVLATSRAPLKVRGESVQPVSPVALPSPGEIDGTRLPMLAAVPSIALFEERATAAAPSFRLTEENAAAVVDICRRVDGLPLAIELAAALSSTLSPAEIAAHLARDGGLRSLQGGASDRHRTLEATLDWSHDLLDPPTQALFRRLAVFIAGWTLEGAENVCTLGEEASTVLPRLTQLVEHSLVLREETAGRSRYRMLAPVAAYAGARLDASGERGAVTLAHALYLVKHTTSPTPVGQTDRGWLDRITAEYDDTRAAFRTAQLTGPAPVAMGFLVNLLGFWRIRGFLREGLVELDRVLATLGTTPSPPRAIFLTVKVDFLTTSGRPDLAIELSHEAEAAGAATGDALIRRTAIALRAIALREVGDLDASRAAFDEAAVMLTADYSDLADAFWSAGVGTLELRRDNLDQAKRHLDRAVESFGKAPSWFLGRVRIDLATVARRQGDRAAAREHLREGLAWLQAHQATAEALVGIEEAAVLALDDRDPTRAATLLAAATALRDATAITPSTAVRHVRDTAVDQARDAMDARRFRAAWARGRGMSLGDVVAFLELADGAMNGATRRRVPHGPDLTPRERDIAALVAEGLTNPQIAERLVISTGTARIHVERILGKLGLTSRVQIATWYLSAGATPNGHAVPSAVGVG
jgi:predicted ATPase/DNA-binding NarL/FixJ family response regulator